ncbi:hypothetical protein [Methylotuvimicrobium buryatense]|nr:hypothetical protein [Methylotuvimicrobium buryatense]
MREWGGAGSFETERKNGFYLELQPSLPHRYVAPDGLLQEYGKKVLGDE